MDVPFGSIKIQNFFLEIFYTFTHEQIHLYKIIRNELFFFFLFFQAIDNFTHSCATIASEKTTTGLDRICLSHDCDSTEMNLQFFSSINHVFTSTECFIRRLEFSFFNRHTKMKRVNVRLLKLERLDRLDVKTFRVFDRNAIVAFFFFIFSTCSNSYSLQRRYRKEGEKII